MKAKKTPWSKRSSNLVQLAAPTVVQRSQPRTAVEDSPFSASSEEYPDWFDGVVRDATKQSSSVSKKRPVALNDKPQSSKAIHTSTTLSRHSVQTNSERARDHLVSSTVLRNVQVFYGKSTHSTPQTEESRCQAGTLSTQAVQNTQILASSGEGLDSLVDQITPVSKSSPKPSSNLPAAVSSPSVITNKENDAQITSDPNANTTAPVVNSNFSSPSAVQICTPSDHSSLLNGHTSSFSGISSDFTSPGAPSANSTAMLFTSIDFSPCNSNKVGSNPNSPQARRRLFNVEEVDSWPVLIANEDGTATELSVDLLGDNNELIVHQEHNNNILPQETSFPSDFGEINNSLSGHSNSDGSSCSSKRRRKNQATDKPAARKRTRDPSEWIVNKRKAAKNAGQSYTNSKGVVVPAKVMGPSCGKCKLQCYKRITEEDRVEVFKKYYEEKTNEGKWSALSRLVQSSPTSTHSENTVSGKNRECARKYFFIIKKKMVRVCRALFLSTLCISETTISTVFKKLASSFKISPDKRGGHRNRPHKTPDAVRESVLNHINSFPRVASHLCRAETQFEYLEPDVQSQSNMYRLYRNWGPLNNVEKLATERQYREIFNNTPGLKINFYQPKKDQCNVCFSFDHLSAEEKKLKEAQHKVHRDKMEIPRNLKDGDRKAASKSSEFCAAVFDLQKVLFTPVCEAGSLFYKRKLSNFNFTIYDLGKHECVCYCWHEGIGKRGANEIASFLMDFIMTKAAEGIKKFHLYCDNCGGQNKNRMVYCMLMHIAAKCNVKIILRFLMTGHTQNEGDSVHALIERKAHNLEMFEPEDWWCHIENVKVTGKPYTVKRVAQEDIYDFHTFVNQRSQWDKNTDGETPHWSQMQELTFNGTDNPWVIQCRYDLEDEANFSVNTKLVTRGHPINLASYTFPRAYQHPLPISAAKHKDLLDLCSGPNPTIPAANAAFYLTLKSSQNKRVDEFYH